MAVTQLTMAGIAIPEWESPSFFAVLDGGRSLSEISATLEVTGYELGVLRSAFMLDVRS